MSKVLELVKRVEKVYNQQFDSHDDIPTLTKIIRLQHSALDKCYYLNQSPKNINHDELIEACEMATDIISKTLEETNRIAGGES